MHRFTRRLIASYFPFFLIAINAFSEIDYQSKMQGIWQCQSQVHSPLGLYSIVAEVDLTNKQTFESSGQVVLEHPSVPAGIPMSFVSAGQWQYFNTVVTASNIEGDVTTPYPILNSFADSLKSEVLAQTETTVRLAKIGKRYMLLVGEDESEITCVR